ncbi:unnamed protein product [Ilex paraguariensis]|uniref:Uncharacterized protein n=1 Tax=Ilex paraguariensis TaxID=185542 RepID=A0ABC8RNA1_9AQUA
MIVEDLEEEIPTCVKDEDCFEDIQDVYDQLFVEFLKQQKNVLALNEKVNSSEEDRKALHVDLVKSKALLDQIGQVSPSIIMHLLHMDRMVECPKLLLPPRSKLIYILFWEERVSPPSIPQPNPSFRKEKQVWVTREDFEKLIISIKLEPPSASSKVTTPKK